MMVFVQGPSGQGVVGSASASSSSPLAPGRTPARIPPTALTANSAPTTTEPSVAEAEPIPPFTCRSGPRILATVAPVPAPTVPSSTCSVAAPHAPYPSLGPGRALGSPIPRSNSAAPGTMGTTATPAGNPIPRSSRYRMTPAAAPKPNALPPARRTPCTSLTNIPGRSRSVSLVAGAPPRTSPDPTVPGGHNTTVQPVRPRGSVE